MTEPGTTLGPVGRGSDFNGYQRRPEYADLEGQPERDLVIDSTAEVCSDAPLHDDDWPSDISVWINGVHVWINGVHLGEWTCPADFGGVRGRLTPSWWESTESQFGMRKRWRVTRSGTTIDGMTLSPVGVDAFHLARTEPIVVRIGVRREAANVGGLNLFGREFGNYPQDLGLRIEYDTGDVAAADPVVSTT